jgi:Phosphotransferase enzyme family
MTSPVVAAAVQAAVQVAAGLGVVATDPMVLNDGANVIIHLSPAPVVAKVAASTVEVRPDPAAWLQRELDLALFLAGQNAPVLTPCPEMPATVYCGAGHLMSFWTYLPPSGDGHRPDEATIGSMLRDLHAVLRSYPAAPPVLAPLQDVPAFLDRRPTRLHPGRSAALATAYARLTAALGLTGDLDPAAGRSLAADLGLTAGRDSAAEVTPPAGWQALHGDAGVGNLMATGPGWVWHDLEDTCTGPVAWDLAATTANPRLDRSRILEAYGATGAGPVDPGQLAVCGQLRRLHLTVWYALYAERLPELRPRAAELLAGWPPPPRVG